MLTGGPGAGKTAALEVIRRHFCHHVEVLPEAASMLFGGGFPRRPGLPARAAAQRAIYHVEVELERIALEERSLAVAVCDRGTLDGVAYWPGSPASFFLDLHTSLETELARYAAVIHLRVPSDGMGYDRSNPMRVESAREAAAIDERIGTVWQKHPHLHVVNSSIDFMDKLSRVLELLREDVPPCCAAAAR